MSKRKGLSIEEKRKRMLHLMYEKKDFFQLKELEKIAPKEKGIILQAVKDVVQSLVDDGLVDSDKIGTSIYFWAFPGKAKNLRKKQIDELNCKLKNVKEKIKMTKDEVEKFKMNNSEGETKGKIINEIMELTTGIDKFKAHINTHRDNDPEIFEFLKRKTEDTKDALNRWTDNLFAIKKWCKAKYFIEEDTLNKQFGIPPELDYIN